MIRAVLFDIDDTLLDFDPEGAPRAFSLGARRTYDYLKGRELPVPSFKTFFRTHRMLAWRMKWLARVSGREQSVRHVLRKLCLKLKLQRDEVSLARLGWLWYEPIVECASVAADVVPTLKALRDGGLKLGIICNTPLQGDVIDQHLKLEGLFDFFPIRIYSSDVGHRKPDARIFKAALHELNVAADETVYVGDMIKTDIAGALKAGMRTVYRRKVANGPDCDLADHTISAIAELLKLPMIQNALKPLQPSSANARSSVSTPRLHQRTHVA
ncbi:MAG TPA: HAD family hydrolase [Tepidisphaeraceae bacterium]|jgi:putative hydrolase of the HAD superfamily